MSTVDLIVFLSVLGIGFALLAWFLFDAMKKILGGWLSAMFKAKRKDKE